MTSRQAALNQIANHRVGSIQDYLERAGADIYGEYVFGGPAPVPGQADLRQAAPLDRRHGAVRSSDRRCRGAWRDKKECLLALSLDGKPLSHDHGAPLRVVSPYDLAYKSSKFVTRIHFSKSREPGWWTLANPVYPSEAPVPKSRLRQQKG